MIGFRPLPILRVPVPYRLQRAGLGQAISPLPFVAPYIEPEPATPTETSKGDAGTAALLAGYGLITLAMSGAIAWSGIWTGINGKGFVRVAGWTAGVIGIINSLGAFSTLVSAPIAAMSGDK